ncbi:putative methyltransferase-domain-containing protein [Dipodascopsis tothii]|uniref:putative methyltransferase-domain-containing protein n=1 Tax=Dipodascopsis tothii TaxID=44089 RepID=UPI0034CDAF59
MFHVRFLKLPAAEARGRAVTLAAVVTVTTDLGESFCEDVGELAVTAVAGTEQELLTGGGRPVAATRARWTGGRTARVAVDVPAGAGLVAVAVAGTGALAGALAVRSAPLRVVRGAAVYAEPGLVVRRAGPVVVAEATGESIMAHVWDSAVALAAHVERARVLPAGPVRVLELGAGCGTAGLALARQAGRGSRVLLTDEAPAEALCRRNMALNAPAAAVDFAALEWAAAAAAPAGAPAAAVVDAAWDVVVACDCTYNPDSYGALAAVLARAAGAAGTVLIVHKRRHGGERALWPALAEAGLAVVSREPLGAAGVELARLRRN